MLQELACRGATFRNMSRELTLLEKGARRMKNSPMWEHQDEEWCALREKGGV